jgi:hypothetical protein
MRQRRGRISLFTLLLLIGIAAGIAGTHRFGPYYWDYWQMKEITKSTARTWRVLGRNAADEKLATMIEDRNLSDYIDPSFCDLHEVGSGFRVQCSWEVDVYYPFSESIRTLSFATEYVAHMDG